MYDPFEVFKKYSLFWQVQPRHAYNPCSKMDDNVLTQTHKQTRVQQSIALLYLVQFERPESARDRSRRVRSDQRRITVRQQGGICGHGRSPRTVGGLRDGDTIVMILIRAVFITACLAHGTAEQVVQWAMQVLAANVLIIHGIQNKE